MQKQREDIESALKTDIKDILVYLCSFDIKRSRPDPLS